MQRQEIEQRILNKQNIANDTQAYPHSSDVISALPPLVEVPSIKDIYQQIKSLPVNDGSKPGRGFSLTELYHTLTKRTPVD
jgi:ribosomal protein L13E